MAKSYNHHEIETKWNKIWADTNQFVVDPKTANDKFYCLDMFPYPSGDGLHVGHWRGYVMSDFYARYMRLQGKTVLHPMGFDAFGLPAENAAIKNNSHPRKFTDAAIENFTKQLQQIGAAYDWSKTLNTSSPEYYRWTQWLFLQLFKKGFAEKRKSLVNWCPKDQTVLANEQVVNGCCERCGSKVTKKELEQWYFLTTKLAEELLDGLETVDWPEHVKTLQRNWIGKSAGAEIQFFTEETSTAETIKFSDIKPELNFIPLWKEKILQKKKTVTFRQSDHKLKPGDLFKLVDHDSEKAFAVGRVKSVDEKLYKDIPLTYPGQEKYSSIDERTAAWNEYHRAEINDNVRFWIYEYEVISYTLRVFTTRPDTLFGVTAIVLAPEHPLAKELCAKNGNAAEFAAYYETVAAKTNVDRAQGKETGKTAIFTGGYAVHPLTHEKLPVWIADYVLMEYGTGAVMSVPAHDERDFQFAKAHDLPINVVIEPITGEPRENEEFRRSIVAIVENPKTGQVLSINWGPDLGGNLFVGGGMAENEDPVETAKREILEETGYKNVQFVAQSETIHHHYIAHSKGVNRYIQAIGLHFQLENDDQDKTALEKDEEGKFTVEWLDKSTAEQKVTDELHRTVFNRLIKGEIFSGAGILVNSGQYSEHSSEEAADRIIAELESNNIGKFTTTYRLRDWLVSRQRYWGAPIPIVYNPEGKPHPVKDEHLPLQLPEDVDFLPGGVSPLARSADHQKLAEKLYGKGWHFDTDTLDTFVDSSWYFLRYLTPDNDKEAFDKGLVEKWLPVDLYVGGIEHATLHLLYARFMYRFLVENDYIKTSDAEPFKKLFNIGMINMHGAKMSKSKGNVVSPDPLIQHYGTDALRGYELFIGPLDIEAEWSPNGINGVHRFLIKLSNIEPMEDNKLFSRALFNSYLGKIETMTGNFRLNTYISAAMEFVNEISKSGIDKETMGKFVITLSPIFPYLSEEVWADLGNNTSIFNSKWPKKYVFSDAVSVTTWKLLKNQKFIKSFTIADGASPTNAQIIHQIKSLGITEDNYYINEESKVINIIVS